MAQRRPSSLADAVELHYEELRSFAARRLGSASAAAELVHETWIRARTSRAALPENPRFYLFRMLANLGVDRLRRARGEPFAEAAPAGLELLASAVPGPERIASDREEWRLLTETIRGLPPKCREVFLLYRGQGLTMREIAAELGIAEKTVEKHIARAMLECRQKLRAQEPPR